MKTLIILALTAAMGGCAANKNVIPAHQAAPPNVDRCCVTTSPDGRYGDEVYTGSGRELSNRIVALLRESGMPQSVVVPAADAKAGAAQCQAEGARAMLIPAILHWEDRATQWSGSLDRITVDVAVADVATREILRRGTFQANNAWATFVNNPPEDLLDDKFAAFIRQLIGSPRPQ